MSEVDTLIHYLIGVLVATIIAVDVFVVVMLFGYVVYKALDKLDK